MERDEILALVEIGTYDTPEASAQRQHNLDKRMQQLGLMDGENSWSTYMEKSFSREEVDASWAYDYETALYTTFTNDPKLAGYSIKALKCRTERCKVVVAMTNPNDMVEASLALFKNLVLQRNGLNYATYLSN